MSAVERPVRRVRHHVLLQMFRSAERKATQSAWVGSDVVVSLDMSFETAVVAEPLITSQALEGFFLRDKHVGHVGDDAGQLGVVQVKEELPGRVIHQSFRFCLRLYRLCVRQFYRLCVR